MEHVNDELVQRALAQAALATGSAALHEALLAETLARHYDEIYAKARADVLAERQGEDEAHEEQRAAREAQQARTIRQAVEAEHKAQHDRELATQQHDYEGRIDRLIARRDYWRTRCAGAEGWIVEHVTADLLPDGQEVPLHRHPIRRLKLHTLNQILAPLGYRVKSRAIPGVESGEGVRTELSPVHWEEHHRFWTTHVTPAAAIVEEPDGYESAAVLEASQDGATIN